MKPKHSHRFGLFLVALVSLAGCATQVTPPPAVQQPGKVFLLDHGRHTSLVLSTPAGELVRYAYGDWRFYAERKTGPGYAIAALLWSTPGGLGRRRLPGPPEATSVRAQVPLLIENLYEIEVERALIEALRAELDALFEAPVRRLETPVADLVFVPHPRDYNLRHNSTTVIAAWLEQLGCEVSGPALLARWQIDQPTMETGK